MSRYTVMFDTRSASATSATVTKRARPSNGCATMDHPSLRRYEGKPAMLLVLLGTAELARPLGRRLHRLEEGGPHGPLLEGQETGGGRAARRRDRRPQCFGC